jgi:hypothetical protein
MRILMVMACALVTAIMLPNEASAGHYKFNV